jgi:hypothetical protein
VDFVARLKVCAASTAQLPLGRTAFRAASIVQLPCGLRHLVDAHRTMPVQDSWTQQYLHLTGPTYLIC